MGGDDRGPQGMGGDTGWGRGTGGSNREGISGDEEGMRENGGTLGGVMGRGLGGGGVGPSVCREGEGPPLSQAGVGCGLGRGSGGTPVSGRELTLAQEFAPSDEELEAYRRGEEWDPARAGERRRLRVGGD